MLSSLRQRALPWTMLLLLLGFHLQGTHAWCSEEEMSYLMQQVRDPDFPDTVKFAVDTFNKQSKDEYAYSLVRILSSSIIQEDSPAIFSMKLQLCKTICKKYEKDINNCPFRDNSDPNNTFICFFTSSIQRSTRQLRILKKTCFPGHP